MSWSACCTSSGGLYRRGWRRFLASLPVARSVVKLGYAFDRAQLEPVYLQPWLVPAYSQMTNRSANALAEIHL